MKRTKLILFALVACGALCLLGFVVWALVSQDGLSGSCVTQNHEPAMLDARIEFADLRYQLLLNILEPVTTARDLADGKVRVPVRLSASSFNPRKIYEDVASDKAQAQFDHWIATSLIAIDSSLTISQAETLVKHDLILPIIDGLDEMDAATDWPSRAATLIRTLNYRAHGTLRSVVLTCRTDLYEKLSKFSAEPDDVPVLRPAAAIQIRPLRYRRIAEYLEDRFPDQDRWRSVVARILDQPDGHLTSALSSPLGLFLAVTGYGSPDTEPAELLGLSGGDLENRLFQKLIPAICKRHPRSESARYEAGDVQSWLARLAAYLNERGAHSINGQTPSRVDLLPHELWPIAGQRVRYVHAVLGAFAVMSALLILARVFVGTPAAWIWYVGQAITGAGGIPAPEELARILSYIAIGSLPLIALRRFLLRWPRPLVIRRASAGVLQLVAAGLAAALVAALLAVALSAQSILSHYGFQLLEVILLALVPGSVLLIVLKTGLGITRMDPRAVRAAPLNALRSDAQIGVGAGIVFGVAASLGAWLGEATGVEPVPGLRLSLLLSLPATFTAGFVIGFVLAAVSWTRYVLAVISSAMRGDLPVSLGSLLKWGYEAGLLRIAGSAFQFRHYKLQDLLADKASSLRLSRRELITSGGFRRIGQFAWLLIPLAFIGLASSFTSLTGPRCGSSTICNASGQPAAMMAWPTTDSWYSRDRVRNFTIGSFPSGTGLFVVCFEHGQAVTGPWGSTDIWVFANWTSSNLWQYSGFVSAAYAYLGKSPSGTWPACNRSQHGAATPQVAGKVSRDGQQILFTVKGASCPVGRLTLVSISGVNQHGQRVRWAGISTNGVDIVTRKWWWIGRVDVTYQVAAKSYTAFGWVPRVSISDSVMQTITCGVNPTKG